MATAAPTRTRQSTRTSKSRRRPRQVQSVTTRIDEDSEDVSNNEGETEINDGDSQAPASDELEEQHVDRTGDESAVMGETSSQVASTAATNGPQQLIRTLTRDEQHDSSQVVRGEQRTMSRSSSSTRAPTRQPDDDDDGCSSSSRDDSGEDGSSSSSKESSSSDDGHSDDGAHERRDAVERNKVSEQVLLAQFYKCLDKTTKKLVKKAPKPTTLEDAVDKATEIDDPMDNVAQGMTNIGLPWATAPSTYIIPMAGTTSQTVVVPGIGGTDLLSTITGTAQASTSDGTVAQGEVALVTNPQGVYNALAREILQPVISETGTKPATKAKTKREPVVSGDVESDAKPKKKRIKTAVKQATSGDSVGTRSRRNVQSGGQDDNGRRDSRACYQCGPLGDAMPECRQVFCLQSTGALCPDAEAKARNDAYLQSCEQQPKPSAGN
ncbi:unnamed protein product [Phytophthora fragariaefolia]|uniref:Unnamed protein product n=1 Tax=Phytophthora fragariaefolia TaxID=1490495 RepID=A0A9W6Y5K1_9STRA|nr:unnamed protein product [Phytophthora fragariaefolia]